MVVGAAVAELLETMANVFALQVLGKVVQRAEVTSAVMRVRLMISAVERIPTMRDVAVHRELATRFACISQSRSVWRLAMFFE